VNSIEINGTFYALQKPATFQNWYDQTPEDFIFSIKAPQFMTHVLRLRDCEEPLYTFLASGLLCLKEKLGPILWQFPPYLTLKDNRFEEFAKILPRSSLEAAELSKAHSNRIDGRSWTEAGGDYPFRHAFELRNPTFLNADFIEMLKSYQVAVVFADSAGQFPQFGDLTSDFVYVRMHGEDPAFKKGYTAAALKKTALKVKNWAQGKQPSPKLCVSSGDAVAGEKDVFVYFNNDEKINSPTDAMKFLKLFKKEDLKKRRKPDQT
jgi:uncharacterized protein YecE (DUF72 family)